MKRIDYIVLSSTPPNRTDVLWLNNGVARYYDGDWIPVKLTSSFKLGTILEDLRHNLALIESLGTSTVTSVDLEGVYKGTTYDKVGTFANNRIMILEGRYVKVFKVNVPSSKNNSYELGEIYLERSYDLDRPIPNYVELTPAASGSTTAARNLTLIKSAAALGIFLCKIDSGYGTGKWTSTLGGVATITNQYGDEIQYALNTDGSVVKLSEYVKEAIVEESEVDPADNHPIDDSLANRIAGSASIVLLREHSGISYLVIYNRVDSNPEEGIYFTNTGLNDTVAIVMLRRDDGYHLTFQSIDVPVE